MKNRLSLLRIVIVGLLSIAVTGLGGCVYACFIVHYEYTGRLLDKDSQPISGTRVIIDKERLNTSEFWWPPDPRSTYGSTDENGIFSGGIALGYWGTTYLFGFIPLLGKTTRPVPPELDYVYVYISQGDEWLERKVELPEGSQSRVEPGIRHIILPDMFLPP